MQQQSAASAKEGSQPDYGAYVPLTTETVASRLVAYEGMGERLGGAPQDWLVREVGDGNLNFVYIVEGPAGSVCVKQALPFVRLVGESWPLPLSRSFFEHSALDRQARLSGNVPEVLRFDGPQALIVMENLGRHVIWRKALIARERHETAAPVLGRFMAETLFRTSDFSLPADVRRREMALFAGNTALCRITEDLVFTDPYRTHPLNRWTSPELDAMAARIRVDAEWKIAAQELKSMFLTRAEALLHGDLHTGSVMVSAPGVNEDIRVIDPEFAVYGPIGFDVGALLANLFLSHVAQDGHFVGDGVSGARDMQAWLRLQAVRTWDAFADRFTELWHGERTGDAYPPFLFEEQGQAEASQAALTRVLAGIERDALGFAGMKMARRILGLAHVEDLESITDTGLRAACETRALTLARALVVERAGIATIAAAAERARQSLGDDA